MLKFFKIITRWRKLFSINILLTLVLSILLSLQMQNWYKAVSILQPSSTDSNGGGLSSVLGLSALGNFGLNFGGGSQNGLIALLKSRSMAVKVISKFDLMQFYERETLEETLKDFYSDFDVQLTEENMIQVSYEFPDSVKSAKIVNFIIDELAHQDISLSLQLAKQESELFENRYAENIRTLDSLSGELENFQKKYGIIELTEQTKAIMNATAEIEAEIVSKKAYFDYSNKTFGNDHPYSKSLSSEIQSLEAELAKIKSQEAKNNVSSFHSLFIPFEQLPKIEKEYAKLYSNLLVQSKLQEFLLPQVEQTKLKLAKNSPSFQIIDKAVPPDYKSRPKRAMIVIAAVFVITLITFIIVLMIEHLEWLAENQKEAYLEWVNVKNKWTAFFKKDN